VVLLFKNRRKSRIDELDIEAVRRRVHGINPEGENHMSLVELFSMVGEVDTIPKPRRYTFEPDEDEPGDRVLPSEVRPSRRNLP
jgi:hypothetical protein